MRILVIDVGGTNAKVGPAERRKVLRSVRPDDEGGAYGNRRGKTVAGWKYGDRTQFERHFFAYPLLRLGTCREADLRARHRTEIIWIDETGALGGLQSCSEVHELATTCTRHS